MNCYSKKLASYKWKNVTMHADFGPRDGAGAFVFKDRMWLIGGWNPNDKKNFPLLCNNEVWSSVDGIEWTLEKINTFAHEGRTFNRLSDWEGRHYAGWQVFKDKMWIIGGDANQGHYHADVWNSTNGKDWIQVNFNNPVPWSPRVGFLSFVFKDKIWIVGGQTIPQFAPAKGLYYSDIWNSQDGISWEKVSVDPGFSSRGFVGGSVVFKDRIWILGGGTYVTPDIPDRLSNNDVWSSKDGIKWECHVKNAPWKPRLMHEVVVFDDKMWILEGTVDDKNSNDVWYSEDGINWQELPDTPWQPRHAASVFVFKDTLWVVAGNNMQSDVWKLEKA